MTTSKLNYANIRSAQRKNKSMHEVKDLLPRNLHPTNLYSHNLSPPFPLEQPSKLSRDPSAKGKVTYSLFEEVPSGDKLNYAKKLFGRYNEEPEKQEEKEKVTRGHHRVKSSITEMYHRGPEILDEEDRIPGGHTFGRFETTTNKVAMGNYNTLHVHERTGSSGGGIAARLEEDYRLMKEKRKENSKQREERGNVTSGQAKEGRLLGDFLRRDGGFGKETASPDDVRPKRKELTLNQEQPGDSIDQKSGVKLYVEKSPRNISIEDNLSPKRDFLLRLDNYIDYFKKSERSHRRGSKGTTTTDYFVEERGKSHEEGVRDTEIKIVKKQVDGLSTKMNEVMKANKKILKEFGHMLTREDEYRHRLGGLEEEFAALRKRNRKYREKLKITTHMLEKERIEHENNIMALNKVLSSGVNMTLEQKIRKYVDLQREKPSKYDNGIGDSHHKRHEERHEKSDWKERNRSSGKRQSVLKDDSMYGQKVSIFSSDEGNYLGKKTGRRDVEEEEESIEEENGDKLNTIEQEQDDLYSSSPDAQDILYKKENFWSPSRQKKGVESSKEYQIRVLQEKLDKLMEERERSKHSHYDKNNSQVWPRTIESTLLSTSKQAKSRNNAKHSGGVNTENFAYTRERQPSHHKGNSFYSREESAFE